MKLSAGCLTICRLRLRTLTPVFVGGGHDSVLDRTGYIYDAAKKTVFILDERKFIEFLVARGWLQEYLRYVAGSGNEQRGGLRKRHQRGNPNANRVHLADWLQAKGVSDYSMFARYGVPAFEVDKEILNDLHCFARNGLGQPYVPGSTIKGALRSILVKEYLARSNTDSYWRQLQEALNPDESQNRVHGSRGQRKKGSFKELGAEIERDCTRRVRFPDWIESNSRRRPPSGSPLRDVFRGISVSDSSPISPGNLFVTRQLRLSTYRKNGHLKALPLYLECLKPGTEITFTLTIDGTYAGYGPWNTPEKVLEVLEGFGRRLSELLGDEVFSGLGDYRWSADPSQFPNFCLGGQTGWQGKVYVPELAPDKRASLQVTRKLLQQRYRRHKHESLDQEISPRTIKLARYEGKTYVMGMCRLEVAEQ